MFNFGGNDSFIWIIILLVLFGGFGNNNDCGCGCNNNDCGCGCR